MILQVRFCNEVLFLYPHASPYSTLYESGFSLSVTTVFITFSLPQLSHNPETTSLREGCAVLHYFLELLNA